MKKIGLILISVFLLSFSISMMAFPVPEAKAVLDGDSASSDVIVYSPSTMGSSSMHYSAHDTGIFQINGFYYAQGAVESGSWVASKFYYSPNGTTWLSTGMAVDYQGGGSSPPGNMYTRGTAYDKTNNVMHTYCFPAWYGGAIDAYYKNGHPDSTTGNLSVQTSFSLGAANNVGGLSSACIMDQKPVLIGEWYPQGGSSYTISAWFGKVSEPASLSDFTRKDVAASTLLGSSSWYYNTVHAVNSTHVLVLFANQTTATKLKGVFCSSAGGWGTAFDASTDTVTAWKDSNNIYMSFVSTWSANMRDSTQYAEDILIASVGASKNLNVEWLDVSTQTISGHSEIFTSPSYNPFNPIISGGSSCQWVFAQNWTDADSEDLWGWEYTANTGWSAGQKIRSGITYFNSGQENLMICSKAPMNNTVGFLYMAGADHDDLWFMLNATDIGIDISADLENIDSGADYVFTDWRYYTFTASVSNMPDLSELVIYFDVETGATGTVTCAFYANSDLEWELATSLTDEEINRFGEPVNLAAGSWSSDEVTFRIFFNDQCLDIWEDAIDIYAWANQTSGVEFPYALVAADYFFVYSKGGYLHDTYSNSALAGQIVGEEWAALYAYADENPTITNATIWFRDLQHVKMLPEVRFLSGYETFYLTTKMEYSTGDGCWLPGWKCIIGASYVSYTGIFAGNVWINMTVSWFQGTGENETVGESSRYTSVKTDNIYMFYHGGVSGSGDEGRFRFWNDQWFNNINASSTGGGRINAYEYPMNDDADLWLRWLANNWGVKDDVAKESSYMADLLDADGNPMSTEKIKMVRVIQELEVPYVTGQQYILLHNYEIMDYSRSPDLPLTGIQTPVFDDTKMPTVGQTGLLGTLAAGFTAMGQWLSENVIFGGLNLWGNFVNFLDTIATWLGAPGFFSQLFDRMADSWAYFSESILYGVSAISNFMVMIRALIATFLDVIADLIAGFVTTITTFTDMMAGGYGAGVNIWNSLGITTWLTVAIIFYPIYLLILWEREGTDAVVSQLTLIFGILWWILEFFLKVGSFIVDAVTGLVESIPVVE